MVFLPYIPLYIPGSYQARNAAESFRLHAEAFNADPEAWEENRQIALQSLTSNFSENVDEAMQLRDGTLNPDDQKTITAVVLETMLRGDNEKLLNFILDDSE